MSVDREAAMEAAWENCLDRGRGKRPFAKGFDAGVRWAATRDEDDPVETIRADQIKVGDSLYIQDEDEWHTASQVVVRDEDVLLWLAGEDHDTDPWDVFPLDATFNRMPAHDTLKRPSDRI